MTFEALKCLDISKNNFVEQSILLNSDVVKRLDHLKIRGCYMGGNPNMVVKRYMLINNLKKRNYHIKIEY